LLADLIILQAWFSVNFKQSLKNKIMGNLLYLIAVILIIFWAIGFIGYHAGGLIHILLVIAVISIILRVIQGKNPV
jgi:hypothetical protein